MNEITFTRHYNIEWMRTVERKRRRSSLTCMSPVRYTTLVGLLLFL